MFENHSKSHFASYVHYKIYMNFRAKISYFTEYNSHILIQFVFRTLFPTRFRRLQCCKMRLFKVVFNHCDPKKRRKKKSEKILKKYWKNAEVIDHCCCLQSALHCWRDFLIIITKTALRWKCVFFDFWKRNWRTGGPREKLGQKWVKFSLKREGEPSGFSTCCVAKFSHQH